MNQCIQIECPQAILVGLHMNTETLTAYVKEQTAIKLLKTDRFPPAQPLRGWKCHALAFCSWRCPKGRRCWKTAGMTSRVKPHCYEVLTAVQANGIHYHIAFIENMIKHAGE